MRIALFMVTSVAIINCTNDHSNSCPYATEEPYLTLTLRTPGSQPGTYSLSKEDENRITTLDVLVFRVDPVDYKEKFLYRVAAADIVDLNDATPTGNLKSYRVKLQLSNAAERHRIVILANQRAQIEANLSEADVNTTEKETMLGRIIFEQPGKWEIDTSSADYKSIPMWGEAANTHVVTMTTTSQSIGTIGLVRALARIDVGVNYDEHYDAKGLENFILTDVFVYNLVDKFTGVPLQANYSKNAAGFVTVGKPTIPGTATAISNLTPLHYTLETGKEAIEQVIYVPEVQAQNYEGKPTATQLQSQFCLVVGGYYSSVAEVAASTPNRTNKTYYRIDIYDRTKTSPQGNLLSILRNHCYKVGITKVSGPGAKSSFEALTQTPLNFSSKVTMWDDGGTQGDVNVSEEGTNKEGEETTMNPWEDGNNGNVEVDNKQNTEP